MNRIAPTDLSNLLVANSLIHAAQNAEDRRKGKQVEEKSVLDYFEEDQFLLGEISSDHQPTPARSASRPIENLNLSLADIKPTTRGGEPAVQIGSVKTAGQNGVFMQTSELEVLELEIRYLQPNRAVDGLVVHDQHYAETDRYLFNFKDGITFTILDKWTSRSTTIWGDPHVDVDDVEGNLNGEFSDLKQSNDRTTFVLMDGTRVVFTAQDHGVIEKVDIVKQAQHLVGVGQASKEFSPEAGLFARQVTEDGSGLASAETGDVVYAGGDGNDWFDASHKLLWGRTQGPVGIQKPSAGLFFQYTHSVSRSVSLHTIAATA